MICSQCRAAETHEIDGVCDDCIAKITAGERAEQGLSPKITDSPVEAAWLARLLLQRERRVAS